MAQKLEDFSSNPGHLEQESPRPPTALRIGRCPTPSTPTSDAHHHQHEVFKPQGSRPTSKRLSTELDELLRWEGFSHPSLVCREKDFEDGLPIKNHDFGMEPAIATNDYDDQTELDVGDLEAFTELSDILTSARKKLDSLEDNLRGARDSLFLAPALPSPASTGSLRSTISSTWSNTFSALSDEDGITQPAHVVAATRMSPSDTNEAQYTSTSLGGYNTPQSRTFPQPLLAGQESNSLAARRNHHSSMTSALHVTTAVEDDLSRVNRNIQPILSYQTKLDAMSLLRQKVKTINRSQSIDTGRLNTTSNPSAHPSASVVGSILPRIRIVDDLSAGKHASIASASTFNSSATETESFSSGWDTDSDESDTEELLHDEFEGTWPMPPVSGRTKPKFACSHLAPSPKLQGLGGRNHLISARPPTIANDIMSATTSAATTAYVNDDGRTTPRLLRTAHSRDLTTPTRDATIPAGHQTHLRATNSSKPSHTTTTHSHSLPIEAAPRTDSKALSAIDQALAFALAESMHEACLWLRDGSEVQKGVFRDRMERARRVLKGEV